MTCADTTDVAWLHRPHIYAALAATDDLARAAELLATCGMIYSEKQLGTYRTRGAHLVDQARELGLAERFFAPPESADDASAGTLWQQPDAGHADTDTDADADTGRGRGMPADAEMVSRVLPSRALQGRAMRRRGRPILPSTRQELMPRDLRWHDRYDMAAPAAHICCACGHR